MKLDYETIRQVESSEDAIFLYTIKKETPYVYSKIKKNLFDRIVYFTVKTSRGRDHVAPFIRREDLELLEKAKKKQTKRKRSFMGRPYSFCEDCWAKDFCSPELSCEKRDERIRSREFIKSVGGDDRFWKNGVPKKHMILCKYAKYMYAHKKTAGQCQKEKCRFYESGVCALGLDKDR